MRPDQALAVLASLTSAEADRAVAVRVVAGELARLVLRLDTRSISPDDVVQEVLIKIHLRPDQFARAIDVPAFFTTVLKRTLADLWRPARRSAAGFDDDTPDVADPTTQAGLLGLRSHVTKTRSKLRALLTAPSHQAQFDDLWDMVAGGPDLEELAQMRGTTVSNISVAQNRLRGRLYWSIDQLDLDEAEKDRLQRVVDALRLR